MSQILKRAWIIAATCWQILRVERAVEARGIMLNRWESREIVDPMTIWHVPTLKWQPWTEKLTANKARLITNSKLLIQRIIGLVLARWELSRCTKASLWVLLPLISRNIWSREASCRRFSPCETPITRVKCRIADGRTKNCFRLPTWRRWHNVQTTYIL